MEIFNGLIIPNEMEEYFIYRNPKSIFLEKIILIHKILQIKILNNEYYEYKKGEIDYDVIKSEKALDILNDFMGKLNIEIPSKVTKDEINAYAENLYINKRSGKFVYLCSFNYDYYDIYNHFNNYICNRDLFNKDFDELRKSHEEDIFEFYIKCIKSRDKNGYFIKNMKNYKIKIYFQSNDYNATYLRYLKAIEYIDKAKKYIDKRLRKSKINGITFFDEYNNINFSIRENSFLTYNRIINNETIKKGHLADYVYSFNEINLYFNKCLELSLKEVERCLYHEIGHFVHHKYLDSSDRNYSLKRSISSFYVKDYISAFNNTKILRYYPDRRYYKYVAPPLKITEKRSISINEDRASAELFAELFRLNIMYKNRYGKLQKMFPHIDYLIRNILNGKGVNKYVDFKD